MSQRRVVLGVTGSIAAYKAAEVVRLFSKAEVDVHCIMTRSATEFLAPTTLATLSEHPVTVDLFGPPAGGAASYGDSGPSTTSGPVDPEASSTAPSAIDHIRASREADLIVVAPATANILGKVAQGIADDALTTTLLATSIPVLYAPAMNTRMWMHPAVQENVRLLKKRGALFVDPGEGELACGEYGAGRMGESTDVVDTAIRAIDAQRPQAPRFLITTGGTEEPVDPVRVLSNRSSGRMGFAIAEAARNAGYRVTVIAARTSAPRPYGVDWISVGTAAEMERAVNKHQAAHDVLVMAAAVSDYRPKNVPSKKISSGAASLLLEMIPTGDILKTVAPKRREKFTVGFALETERGQAKMVAAGQAKLARKGVDLLVLNNPMRSGSEFGGNTNEVSFLFPDGRTVALPLSSKYEIGVEIVRQATHFLSERKTSARAITAPTVKKTKKKAAPKAASRKTTKGARKGEGRR